MKINNINSYQVNMYKNQLQKQAELQRANKKDKVEISSAAKDMQLENQFLISRDQKIESIKQSIENGTYKIDPKLTAKKMLDFYR